MMRSAAAGAPRIITFGRQHEGPRAPWEVQDAVELYARKSGRSATVRYAPNAIQMPDGRWEGCWFVDFTLRPNDPRMRLYQEGLASEPPKERVWFFRREHGGQLVPLDIFQMGVSGVTEFLERGDTWSGRGEYSSIEDAYRKTEEANARFKERKFEEARQDAIDRAMDKRRTLLKVPFLRVGKDLRGERKG